VRDLLEDLRRSQADSASDKENGEAALRRALAASAAAAAAAAEAEAAAKADAEAARRAAAATAVDLREGQEADAAQNLAEARRTIAVGR